MATDEDSMDSTDPPPTVGIAPSNLEPIPE